MIDNIAVKHFRCFTNTGILPLRPLTFLVGENSTGKTSFLSAIRLAWDIAYSPRRLDFNEEPFLLGAFDQIANFRGGRAGRAENFEFDFQITTPLWSRTTKASRSPNSQVRYKTGFRRAGSHPVISSQSLQWPNYSLSVTFSETDLKPEFVVQVGERTIPLPLEQEQLNLQMVPEASVDWFYLLRNSIFYRNSLAHSHEKQSDEKLPLSGNDMGAIQGMLMSLRAGSFRRPIAIAPVRTRPQRTYNPVSETPLPEGEHVPMVLAKTYFEDKRRWESLKVALEKFGSASGLFSSLEIKSLGRHESDPFQIRVKIEGPPSNLMDVGYGVSQVLPILVDSLLADEGSFYLLQQPEVHLHPRAQAELGTFLATLVAKQSIRFVVETHSDYLLDRIRMDVRDKKVLKPDDISILFFERLGGEIVIRPLEIDANGNLLRTPSNYRQFFLHEERRFLGASN